MTRPSVPEVTTVKRHDHGALGFGSERAALPPGKPARNAVRAATSLLVAVMVALLLPGAQPPVVLAADAVTGLYLDSVPGDDIGRGVPELWPSASWGGTESDGSGIVAIRATVFGPGPWLDLRFAAPAGQHLEPGMTYAGGVEAGTCVEPVASAFTLHEMVPGFDAKLAVSFWVECNMPGAVFRGELRVNSAVAFRALVLDALAVRFATVPGGTTGETKTITISSRGNGPLTIASVGFVTPTTDFVVTSETCTAAPVAPNTTCDVVVQFSPDNGGLRTAKLVIDDDTARGQHVIALSGTAVGPASGLAWGSTAKAGPAYTWNGGGALGRTVQSGTQRLHLAYGTDRIGARWAKDGGPYAGIYYVRSTSGATWSAAKRVNPSTQHATMLGLAAAGSRVYVTWASQTKIHRYSPTAPRTLYVRVNTSHGTSSAWKSAVRLTSRSGRVDYPSIAASGTDAHVAWTDSVTGDIRVATTRDRGVTWRKTTIGKSSWGDETGKRGHVDVAVAGSTVAVAWRANAAGAVKVRVSTNRGVSWRSEEIAGGESGVGAGLVAVAVRGSTIAVAWLTRTTVMVRERVGGAWGDPVMVTAFDLDVVGGAFGPAIALQDPSRVAVTWTEEASGDDAAILRWAESADGGRHWFATQTIAGSTTSRRVNDWASIVWAAPNSRLVVWNGWTPGTTAYRLYLRKGAGTPVTR